jgi:hypothetical protein
LEGSGSNAKTLPATAEGKDVDVMVIASGDRVQIGVASFDRYELLEAMGVTDADVLRLRNRN